MDNKFSRSWINMRIHYDNMARSGINKVILVGNLGQDPEVKYTAGGAAVTTLSLATSDSWKDKETGSDQERTEWHRVVFFNKPAETIGQYVRKGQQLYVEGRLQTRKWQDKDGNDKYTTEILGNEMNMLGGRQSSSDSGEFDQSQPVSQTAQSPDTQISEEDIPF